ncbi:hypothetical protein BU23DRAFT_451664 [Bimuria novae-zelandiae CBS 107.79]|uniref:Gag1-like clamp domain-containing protein n=1 Tax=Bimuria novae-zelandiae CBS 107.79 TaxID=1447943 RepID=A0A6A5VLV9_9PLEO|nr:hypothetical protein BU23DRAFT_451664 [Bimuria novae-zelandiae CBS 107.79]
MENNQSASRAARRFLEERVRNDWNWPDVPDVWSQSDDEVRGVTSFRERYYGDSSPSESEAEGAADSSDPYRFDDPDSVGNAVELKAQRRTRKRYLALEEEMRVNEGLRLFVERRDAWTGVASVRKYGATGRTAQAQPDAQTADTERTSSDLADTLVPVAPPLLLDNAIRKSISPKAYSDIFNKIVVSSRTPAVPINLSDMTKALVVGWKENGEWPPKAATLDPLAGKRRAALTAVHGEPFLAHHPHLQKGVDSVRKIFHMNGQANHGANGTPGLPTAGG